MKWIFLALFPICAQAQTYDVSLNLDGVTYAGSFTYTPTFTENSGGQQVTLGEYTNVSLSDPYAGTLTSINDPYDGNNVGEHELWFLNGANMPVGINIPDSGVQGRSVPVTGALAYVGPGSLDYVTCTACDASITEVVSNGLLKAPELDPRGIAGAFSLLLAGLAIVRGRRVNRPWEGLSNALSPSSPSSL